MGHSKPGVNIFQGYNFSHCSWFRVNS